MNRKFSIITVAAFFVLAATAWAAVFFATPGRPTSANFEVRPGESAAAVADRLKQSGFVHSATLFRFVLTTSGFDKVIQPGSYDLGGAATLRELAERLTKGGISATEFVLLIKEGEDLRDLQESLKRAGYGGADQLYDVTGEPAADCRSGKQPRDFSGEFAFLKDKPDCVSLEGYLFPDTYRLPRAAPPEDIVRRLLVNFGRKLKRDLAGQVAASGHSLHEIVTMASVIEKEVRTEKDRRLVADIFWRRLAEGMPLQADSTVNYVAGSNKPAVGAAELAVDSRYNTYVYPGLPPGPIDNPGLAALWDATSPEANDWWYFLTDSSGQVHYAKTNEEHAANKAKYLNH
ncbi:MAG: endolytic transglycosylase MltG [Patescibacteria group bacterium]|nr:endolytic transglycosylase MltG [Patescibacteria group bacterium]